MDTLIKILEKSVKKNGEVTLTNKHLLNILKMAIRSEEKEEYNLEMEGAAIDCGQR